jgi:hypothetical protein
MIQKVGRRSHGGVYRKTEDISTNAAAAIGKWRFVTEIHRQTACVKFWRDDRVFYWHPVAKKFRREGEATWSHLPSGRGIVALMLHLHGKEELLGIPHFGAMIDGYQPTSAAVNARSDSAAGSASPRPASAGESHSSGHARAEISRTASPNTAHETNTDNPIDFPAEMEAMAMEGMQR